MPRDYQPEGQLDPRVSSEGRKPAAPDPPETDGIREQAACDGYETNPGAGAPGNAHDL